MKIIDKIEEIVTINIANGNKKEWVVNVKFLWTPKRINEKKIEHKEIEIPIKNKDKLSRINEKSPKTNKVDKANVKGSILNTLGMLIFTYLLIERCN